MPVEQEPCRDCGAWVDVAWLVDGRCEGCRARTYRLNVLAERD